jgi:hypothetical protein
MRNNINTIDTEIISCPRGGFANTPKANTNKTIKRKELMEKLKLLKMVKDIDYNKKPANVRRNLGFRNVNFGDSPL